MRKQIISFLYSHRFLKSLIPFFHYVIGQNRIRGRKSGNEIQTTTANIFRCKFDFKKYTGNNIFIDENSDFHNSEIIFRGTRNKIVIGRDSWVNGVQLVLEGNNNAVILGNKTFILDNMRVFVVDGTTFKTGNDCMFSDRIEIRTSDHHSIIDRSTRKRINPEGDIILHDHVWCGTGVTLLKGTELASGTIVGAGSIVTQKINKQNTIIAGNPAKEIKHNVDWKMERI